MKWLVVLVMLCGRAVADPAAVRKLLDERRQQLHIAGLAYAVVIDDRVVALDGLGLRDPARTLPATPDTVFPIGSCTKAFTAMAAAIASDEGKLSLDDSPRRYLPWFKLADPEANELVAIRDLLSHRTGLMAKADLAATPGVLTREQYLRAAAGAKPVARLREAFQYSNAMVTAAGEAVARAYGTTWERVIETRILAPLGMTATRTSSYRIPGEAAVGQTWDGKAWRATPVTESLGVMAPAGSIASTARDMARWLRMLTGGGVLDGKRVVSEAMLRELTAPHIAIDAARSYALGWVVYDWKGHRVIEHNGGSDGLSALVSFLPDRRAGFVVLANSSPTEMTQIGKLGAALWPAILDEAPAPVAAAAAPIPRAPAAPEAALSKQDLPALDAWLDRMVQATGGARNARGHATMRLHATGSYEQQGVSFELSVLARETARVEDEAWRAAGVRLGRVRIFFDGERGAQQTTFGQDEVTTDIARARRDNALHPLLDLRAHYSAVAITGRTQLDGEDVIVVALDKETTLYASARTALVVRRDRGGESTRFSDFRNSDGEIVPWRWTTHDALGDKTVRVDRIEWNVALPAGSFAPVAHLTR